MDSVGDGGDDEGRTGETGFEFGFCLGIFTAVVVPNQWP